MPNGCFPSLNRSQGSGGTWSQRSFGTKTRYRFWKPRGLPGVMRRKRTIPGLGGTARRTEPAEPPRYAGKPRGNSRRSEREREWPSADSKAPGGKASATAKAKRFGDSGGDLVKTERRRTCPNLTRRRGRGLEFLESQQVRARANVVNDPPYVNCRCTSKLTKIDKSMAQPVPEVFPRASTGKQSPQVEMQAGIEN